jgi:hypothetical protein
LIAGGIFYFWFIYNPPPPEESSPPTLFGANDYKVTEKNGAKYIEIEKIGFTAKVPEGWKIEKKQTPDIEPQYWVRLYSDNYKPSPRTSILPGKGCKIDVSAWTSKESNLERKKIIKELKAGKEDSIEDLYIKDGYNYSVVDINNHEAVQQKTSKDHVLSEFAQAILVDIPINGDKVLTLYIDFPPSDKEMCINNWGKFLKTIEIK